MAIIPVKSILFSLIALSLVNATAIDRSHLIRREQAYEVKKNVVVTEQVNVYEQKDGSFVAAAAVPVATKESLTDPIPIPDKKNKAVTPPAPAPAPVPVSNAGQSPDINRKKALPKESSDDKSDEDDSADIASDDDSSESTTSPKSQVNALSEDATSQQVSSSESKSEAIEENSKEVPDKANVNQEGSLGQQKPTSDVKVEDAPAKASEVEQESSLGQQKQNSEGKTGEAQPLGQQKPNSEGKVEEAQLKSNVTQDGSVGQETPTESGLQTKAAASKQAKRGVAYNDVTKLTAFTSSAKVSWAYNWASTSPALPGNVEYVPMLWGTGGYTSEWTANANKAIASGSTHLLAFNEPDLDTQSALSVADAVAGYQNLVQPFAGKAKLGSPAVTNGGAPMGLTYLKNFIAACSGCTVDFVAIHWYNGGNANDFKNYVRKAHEAGGGRPVWITEFQASGDAAQQQAFLNDVLPWLDQQDFVERYAYFMAADGNLISSGTTLSPVGQVFAFGN